MWMVGGYNESSHHHQLSLAPHDAFSGRKLRPLIPRPPVVSSTACASSVAVTSCNLGRYGGSDLFSLGQHLGVVGEQGSHKKEMNMGPPPVVVSTSRWNPTPEQLRVLEDLYRRGTRTPSTEQIQQITSELRKYGKIEGKNVFYWFQNHKARERQKRRRELELLPHDHHLYHHQPIIERKERGAVEQSRGYYSIAAEESGVMSMQRAASKAGRRAAAVSEQPRRDNIGWLIPLDDEREFQKHHFLSYNSRERNATWHHLTPFCFTTSPPPPPTTATAAAATAHLLLHNAFPSTEANKEGEGGGEGFDDENDDVSATLQLFPLRSHLEGGKEGEEDDQHKYGVDDEKERDIHFFEFLPPKN